MTARPKDIPEPVQFTCAGCGKKWRQEVQQEDAAKKPLKDVQLAKAQANAELTGARLKRMAVWGRKNSPENRPLPALCKGTFKPPPRRPQNCPKPLILARSRLKTVPNRSKSS